jgi:large subunit ribosomal protein L24
MTVKIRKGDEVEVISGKDLGVRGRVIEVNPKKGRVLVEGINRVTRHEPLRMSQGRGGTEGGIIHKEASIDISNVALICPTHGPTRAGYRIEDGTGGKLRVCTKCGTEI